MKFPDLNEAEVAEIAARLATILRDGDALFLHGDLGAGKTSFARALIRTLCDRPDEEVPSPTFSLVQQYQPEDYNAPPIWHFDLYRIDEPEDVYELGFEDALSEGIVVIEWPERLGPLAPAGALQLHLEISSDNQRRDLTFSGPKAWAGRLSDLTNETQP